MSTKTNTTIKTYSGLMKIDKFYDRYEYLKVDGRIGDITFGHDRYLNQMLYGSVEWKRVRDRVIVRDEGCDMGHPNYLIGGKIIVHHINPITKEDLIRRDPKIFDMENLICVSHNTHEAIHYGSMDLLPKEYVPRRPNDTCPWRCANG